MCDKILNILTSLYANLSYYLQRNKLANYLIGILVNVYDVNKVKFNCNVVME